MALEWLWKADLDAIMRYSKEGAPLWVALEWLRKADLDAMLRYSKDGAPL